MNNKTELRAAAARLLYNDNRDTSDYNMLIDFIDNYFDNQQPTVKSVPLYKIFHIIAGHSNYHGDNILTALTCLAEGKEVKNVEPLQQPTTDGWIPCGKGSRLTRRAGTDDVYCIDSHKCVDGDCYDCPHFAYMRNKLACYEELEEQGRLAYLPYKESE